VGCGGARWQPRNPAVAPPKVCRARGRAPRCSRSRPSSTIGDEGSPCGRWLVGRVRSRARVTHARVVPQLDPRRPDYDGSNTDPRIVVVHSLDADVELPSDCRVCRTLVRSAERPLVGQSRLRIGDTWTSPALAWEAFVSVRGRPGVRGHLLACGELGLVVWRVRESGTPVDADRLRSRARYRECPRWSGGARAATLLSVDDSEPSERVSDGDVAPDHSLRRSSHGPQLFRRASRTIGSSRPDAALPQFQARDLRDVGDVGRLYGGDRHDVRVRAAARTRRRPAASRSRDGDLRRGNRRGPCARRSATRALRAS
jgi:hypothetical protein